MTQRALILLAVCLVGFSAVFALPTYKMWRTAMPGGLVDKNSKWELPRLVLPRASGDSWIGGRTLRPSSAEVTVLAKDTRYAKRNYTRQNHNVTPEQEAAGQLWDELATYVVTSGSDMGNSIHRPERCLTAQGFNIEQEKKFTLQVNGKALPVKKLRCSMVKNGKTYQNVTYYWFVGHRELTNNHWERTWIDIRDRLFEGHDQEWAYASVTLSLTPHSFKLRSAYEPLWASAQAQFNNGQLTEPEYNSIVAMIDRLDEIHGESEEAQKFRRAEMEKFYAIEKEAEQKQAANLDKKLRKEFAKIKAFFDEHPVNLRDDIYGMTRAVSDEAPAGGGLSQADEICQDFIIQLAKEVIDKSMITAWNQAKKP